MFLEDELEYVRLKRNDNIMGWLAIVFVAALVFMFAGIMNSASATGANPQSIHPVEAHRAEMIITSRLQVEFAAPASSIGKGVAVVAPDDAEAAPAPMHVSYLQNADIQTLALATPQDNAGVAHASMAKLADHDIKTGALLLSFALMGGSFVMLAFGGPRGGKREDEDAFDAL